MIEYLTAGQDLALSAHQQLQQKELLGRQLHRLAGPVRLVASGVEVEAYRHQGHRALPRAAADDGAQAGEQFGDGERLHQVVVGDGVEPAHTVLHAVTGRQDDDEVQPALGSQGSADLQAVGRRDYDVEHQGVIVELGRGRSGLPGAPSVVAAGSCPGSCPGSGR